MTHEAELEEERKWLCEDLRIHWNDVAWTMEEDSIGLFLDEFIGLFEETWQYFLEEEQDDRRMMRDSAAIIAAMVPITRLEHCPKRVKQYVVDACAVYVRGFIESVCNPDLGEGHCFKDGWIWYLPHNTGSDSYQHIDNFEEDLEKLAREYWEAAADGEEFQYRNGIFLNIQAIVEPEENQTGETET